MFSPDYSQEVKKINMSGEFLFILNSPIIQSPQTPESDIIDDSEEETVRATVPQVSLTVNHLPPFPCLCNAHVFINKVASL